MNQWIRYTSHDSHTRFGLLDGRHVHEHGGNPFGQPVPTGRVHALDEVELLSPCAPSKIVALWNNFHALAAKLEKAVPQHPLFLIKPGTSVIGPHAPIERPASYAGKIVYEGELGIVIGKVCRNVPLRDAASHIFGYTCVNDVTAGELLHADPNFPQWTRAKGFDTFGCLGPAIATDFDWRAASVVTRVDGVERQNYPLSDMVFPPEALVSLISQDLTLLPGDVIACGTSVGVGAFKDGSTVEVLIQGIGTLCNRLGARQEAAAESALIP
jgi:2-keto-4-pentenoate hydratase/2-oxohepta-3-ene-1,7-dioic acid hydratase in catechol pathway